MEYFSPEDIVEANPYTTQPIKPRPQPLASKGPSMAKPAAPQSIAPQNPTFGATTPQEGMMGYGQILRAMNSPEAWEAGMEAGLARSDASAQRMMQMGEPRNIPYGGKMSWAEALNNGIKQGMGMYDYLQSQKAKANALRKYQNIFDKMNAQQKEAELFSPGRGSGQTSVQGNPDYVSDL